MNYDNDVLEGGLSLNQNGVLAMAESAKWGRFLGIIGFVISGLIALTGLGMLLFMSRTVDNSLPSGGPELGAIGKFGAAGLSIFYLILAGIGFLLSTQCYKFSQRINAALATQNSIELNLGLDHLRKLFRIYGIIVLVYLGILLLAIIGTIIGMGAGAV